jgi:demethylmenaquinone methyltransferase/2-methoxy-6-polyprenyl-1,4-benzoquinol methylase
MLTRQNIHIRDNFDAIAPRYDITNRIISFGIDLHWRKVAVRQLMEIPEDATILDLACGTCDMARELLRRRPRARVIGADLSLRMLERGQERTGDLRERGPRGQPGRLALVNAPAEALPFPDGSFDAAMIAFGIRNVPEYAAGLREMLRILKPGGRVCILEFSTPPSRLFSSVYRLYFIHVLPWIGGWITGRRQAYRYLTDSVSEFPGAEAFRAAMQEAGFTQVNFRRLTGGIVCVHTGVRP